MYINSMCLNQKELNTSILLGIMEGAQKFRKWFLTLCQVQSGWRYKHITFSNNARYYC